MARYEGNLREHAEEPLKLDELIALLGSIAEADEHARNDAIACALSASEGWQEAVRRLRGAFADEGSGLRDRKDDLPED